MSEIRDSDEWVEYGIDPENPAEPLRPQNPATRGDLVVGSHEQIMGGNARVMRSLIERIRDSPGFSNISPLARYALNRDLEEYESAVPKIEGVTPSEKWMTKAAIHIDEYSDELVQVGAIEEEEVEIIREVVSEEVTRLMKDHEESVTETIVDENEKLKDKLKKYKEDDEVRKEIQQGYMLATAVFGTLTTAGGYLASMSPSETLQNVGYGMIGIGGAGTLATAGDAYDAAGRGPQEAGRIKETFREMGKRVKEYLIGDSGEDDIDVEYREDQTPQNGRRPG